MPPKAWNKIDRLLFTACNDSAMNAGFEAVSPRQWVRTRVSGIRDLVWITKEKGGIYSACWGFSLDFAPLVRNERVTNKANKSLFAPDIVFDPYDCHGSDFKEDDWTLYSELPSTFPERVNVDVWEDTILPAAERHLRSVRSIADLLPVFERKRCVSVRYGWDTTVGLRLAYIFTLAELGHRLEAMAAYLHWASENRESQFAIEKVKVRLLKTLSLRDHDLSRTSL